MQYYSISTNNKTQILYTSHTKLRLLNIGLEASFTEALEHLIDIFLILEFILGVDYNIIKVSYIEII